MKKTILFLIITFIASALSVNTVIAHENTEEPAKDLIVFAASSMTDVLSEISTIYKENHPNINLIFNFDSSGTLKTQVEEGADCDLFISASQKPLNQLEEMNYLLKDTRCDLLENKVALAVPEGNPAGIQSFEDVISRLQNKSILLAIGNEDVPVGEYTLNIFRYYQMDNKEILNSGCITFGSNAKEVTTHISESVVDCGIIYSTDAFSASLEIVDTANSEICGQIIYPAAILSTAANSADAEDFLSFLQSEETGYIFESHGFTPIIKETTDSQTLK